MKRFDYLIIVLVAVIAVGSLGVLFLKPRGNFNSRFVEIKSENKLYKRVQLTDSTNQRITVNSELGNNIIDISNGSVKIHDADCPDKICIKDGAIKNPGDILVCLPNKVVVEIKGVDNDEIDALSE